MMETQIDGLFEKLAHVDKDFKLEWDAYRYLIAGKMFAMRTFNKQQVKILTLKLPPQEGAYYREQYDFISEGYYMNKLHWISIAYEQCDAAFLEEVVEKSYQNFIANLPKKVQRELEEA